MNALIFPLRAHDLKKSVLALKGATSPRFFDKKTEMGRKGKLARGRTKGSPSWKAGCQGARNASKKKANLPANKKENMPLNHFDQWAQIWDRNTRAGALPSGVVKLAEQLAPNWFLIAQPLARGNVIDLESDFGCYLHVGKE